MKQILILWLSCVAGFLAIDLSLTEDERDEEMVRSMQVLEEENASLKDRLGKEAFYHQEMQRTEAKITSDLETVTERFYAEDMTILVTLQEIESDRYQAHIRITTNITPSLYAELIELVEETITMEDVHVRIVAN